MNDNNQVIILFCMYIGVQWNDKFFQFIPQIEYYNVYLVDFTLNKLVCLFTNKGA